MNHNERVAKLLELYAEGAELIKQLDEFDRTHPSIEAEMDKPFKEEYRKFINDRIKPGSIT
jgi:hypothetical protein